MTSILEIIGDSSLAGAPRHLLSILKNIDHKKFKMHVICPAGPLAGEIREIKPEIDLDIIPMRSRLDQEAIKKIKNHIRQIKPDLIHVHGTRAGSLGRLAAIGSNIPVIYTEHLWTKHFQLSNKLLNFLHYFSYFFLDLITTTNIAVSNAVKEFMVDTKISRPEKIHVIYNGIEKPEKQAQILENDQIKLVSVATLNENKGIQYLISALPLILKSYPNVQLEIIGDGSFRRRLEDQVELLKLTKKVHFAGFSSEVETLLSEFDLYVQPSLSESFGLAIVQAMSVGLPVVATSTGGIPEVVIDGKTGYLVPPKDVKALAKAIIEILSNREQAKKFGKTGAEIAKEKFSLKKMMDELEKVYEETVKTGPFAQ